MSKELGVSYNVSKLEPKLKPHQFPGFLNGLPTTEEELKKKSSGITLETISKENGAVCGNTSSNNEVTMQDPLSAISLK